MAGLAILEEVAGSHCMLALDSAKIKHNFMLCEDFPEDMATTSATMLPKKQTTTTRLFLSTLPDEPL